MSEVRGPAAAPAGYGVASRGRMTEDRGKKLRKSEDQKIRRRKIKR
jgi:hypothetical protein